MQFVNVSTIFNDDDNNNNPISNLDLSNEVTIVSMFSNNIQYQIREPLKVLLIMNEEKQLLDGVFMDRELNVSIERKLIKNTGCQ